MDDSQYPDVIVSKEKFDRWCRNIDNSKGGYSYIWFHDNPRLINRVENVIQKRRIFKRRDGSDLTWSEGDALVCNSPCGKGWCMVVYEY